MQFDYGNHHRVGPVDIQYMLEKLEGYQIRFFVIKPQFEKAGNITHDQRAAAYDFIREKGPRSTSRHEFMEWKDREVHDTDSKFNGWPEGKVRTSLLI